MKTLFVIATSLALTLLSFAAGPDLQQTVPANIVNFRSADVRQVLAFYSELAAVELVTSSHVDALHAKITLQPEGRLTAGAIAEAVEKALIDQAGIVITRIDAKRASVTYNDAL